MMPSSSRRATRLPVFTANESIGTRVRRRRKAVPDLPPAEPRVAPGGHAEFVANAAHFTRIVRSGICAARTSVDIMTADFKAMLVPDESVISTGSRGRGRRNDARSIVEVFRDLAARGVEIRLLHAGTPSSAALRELKQSLPANLTIRRCPRLHAKAVIVDARGMYLGSANLTGAGLGAKADGRRNFELGVWTESAALIDAVLEHFNDLWEGRDCKSCKRKDVCPVPLEEPAL
jgi:phosphatidylserine/phosphatidylglycerophosphate/cardiolipin synthase-like enzyme